MVSAKEAIRMATVNGSKALGRDDLGEVAPGKKADLILIDLDKPHFLPLHNPVSARLLRPGVRRLSYYGKRPDTLRKR